MRAVLPCAILLLTALAPVASAHDDPPALPSFSIGPDPCGPLLPVYDYAVCYVESLDPDTSYAMAWATYIAHQAGCHVVGGPACVV